MDTISQTVEVFVKLSLDKEKRLKHGAQLRHEMHEAIKAGKRPGGYRPGWIRQSAGLMIGVLGEIAAQFDLEHPEDKASLSDLCDITATCMGLLKKDDEE